MAPIQLRVRSFTPGLDKPSVSVDDKCTEAVETLLAALYPDVSSMGPAAQAGAGPKLVPLYLFPCHQDPGSGSFSPSHLMNVANGTILFHEAVRHVDEALSALARRTSGTTMAVRIMASSPNSGIVS